MTRTRPVQTDIVVALDRNGRVLCEMDGTNPAEAAKKFAGKWRKGLINRVQDDDAPLMDKSELDALSKHAWRNVDGIRFLRVYYDGDRRVFPEGERYSDVARTTMADAVSRAVGNLAQQAWRRGLDRIDRATAETKANLAVDRADEYVKGLEEVAKLDAMHQLKSAIEGMTDPTAKASMMNRYPELFDNGRSLSRMAQEQDAPGRAARVKEWEKQHAAEAEV